MSMEEVATGSQIEQYLPEEYGGVNIMSLSVDAENIKRDRQLKISWPLKISWGSQFQLACKFILFSWLSHFQKHKAHLLDPSSGCHFSRNIKEKSGNSCLP